MRDLEVPFGDEVIRVSVSMGAARLVPGESASEWLGHADAALARAESEGSDRLVLWAP